MTEYIEKQSALSLVSCVGERRMTSSAPNYLGYHDAVEEIKNALVDMPAKGFSVEFAVDLSQRISNVMSKVLDVIVSDLTLTLDQRDAALREQWALFGDIPMNPETECIEQPFLSFDAGTHREDIWHWFDKRYSKGVHALMYGEEATPAEDTGHIIRQLESLKDNARSFLTNDGNDDIWVADIEALDAAIGIVKKSRR